MKYLMFLILLTGGCGETGVALKSITTYVNYSSDWSSCTTYDDAVLGGGCTCTDASHHVYRAEPSDAAYYCGCATSGGVTGQAVTAFVICGAVTETEVFLNGEE